MKTLSKKEILQKLSELDLSKYPCEEANQLISGLGKYGAIVTYLPLNKSIIRARVNCISEEFSNTSQLSYKPSEFNFTFQRASTPNTTMFYGAVLPENIKDGEIDCSRLVGTCEISNLFRDKSIMEGEQTITFGKWTVTNDIPLISIVHYNDYHDQNSLTKELFDDYNKFINSYPTEIIEESITVSEFFANQFAKAETPNDYDYLLSAIYTERISQMKIENLQLAGVYYPSVRTEGKGFNVAISPKFADSSLELSAVVECVLYKKGNYIVVDNVKEAILSKGEKEFILEKITDPKIHLGREKCYEILESKIKKN